MLGENNLEWIDTMKLLKNFFCWLLALSPETELIEEPENKLMLSMKVTAKSRFNASVRLRNIGKYTFFTTVMLSLGLILIPLLQNSDLSLHFSTNTLNMMQIFLAVSILVYSVINAKADYEVRAEKLNLCGDKIKELSRRLEKDIKNAKGSSIEFDNYLNKYNEISQDSENHTREDYLRTKLQMRRYYNITGINRFYCKMLLLFSKIPNYTLPTGMIALEMIFISDMLGITHILTPYLSCVASKTPIQ